MVIKVPPIMLNTEPILVNNFGHIVHSLSNMSFWCLFLDPQLTTHHSNIASL